jgi:hypothetical protein
MPGKKRTEALAAKQDRKARAMLTPGAESKYARKKKYCDKNGVWGFEVAEPKPWK